MICMHKSTVITWHSNKISLRSLYGDNCTLYPFLLSPLTFLTLTGWCTSKVLNFGWAPSLYSLDAACLLSTRLFKLGLTRDRNVRGSLFRNNSAGVLPVVECGVFRYRNRISATMLHRLCIAISFIHTFECPYMSLRQTIASRVVGRN